MTKTPIAAPQRTAPAEAAEFVERARTYLRQALDRPDLEVTDTYRAVGGGSRITRAVTVVWDDRRHQDKLIFRLDRQAGILDSNRDVEFEMHSAFHPIAGVPVPQPILVENDPRPLGTTFMLMKWLPGAASKAGVLRPEYDAIRPALGRQMFEILGTIARTPVSELRLPTSRARSMGWQEQLSHWEGILAEHALGPTPVFDAVVRYLRGHPPEPAKLAVVHGDFRIGNLLYTPDEGIQGVLDWELAHLGDPHEDLAYACLSYWRPLAHPNLIAGAISEAEAIAVWERASGLVANRQSLRLWTMYAYVWLCAVISTGAYFVAHGEATNALQTATGITEPPRHQLLAADLIEVFER